MKVSKEDLNLKNSLRAGFSLALLLFLVRILGTGRGVKEAKCFSDFFFHNWKNLLQLDFALEQSAFCSSSELSEETEPEIKSSKHASITPVGDGTCLSFPVSRLKSALKLSMGKYETSFAWRILKKKMR